MAGDLMIPFQGGDRNALMELLSDPFMMEAAKDFAEDVTIYQSFPTISIKGKVWALVKGDERSVMKKDDGETVQTLEMVLLRANDKARVYYKTGFVEGKENEKPTCYSNDSIAPSDRSVEKQSPQCATCQWAVFGTARGQNGEMRKGSACSQNARLAVAAPGKLDEPHLLRVPPTSLKPMRDAIDVLRKRNIPYPAAIMRMQFVAEESSPLLKFTPIGLLTKEVVQKALTMRENDVVRAICGLDDVAAPAVAPAPAAAPVAPAKEDLGSALDASIAQQTAAAAPAQATPAQAPVQAPPPPPPAPAPAPAPVQAATKPVVVTAQSGNLLGELGDILGNLDG